MPANNEIDLVMKLKRLAGRLPAGVRVGIGDDCAVLAGEKGCVRLLTTDQQIEGVHFRRDFAGLYDVGRKALAVNVSDIAAMGGEPRYFVMSLAVPPGEPDIPDLIRGVMAEARKHKTSLVGGDIARSPSGLGITITMEGICPETEVLTRHGAEKTDLLYLLGFAGRSALGMALLERGFRLRVGSAHAPRSFGPLSPSLSRAAARAMGAHLRPRALAAQGRSIARSGAASAMIDTSDGLSRDIRNLSSASRAGAVIETALLPMSGRERELAGLLGEEWLSLAVHGGEDYALMFTVPGAKVRDLERIDTGGVPCRRIGRLTDGRLIVLEDEAGDLVPLPDGGWDHVRSG